MAEETDAMVAKGAEVLSHPGNDARQATQRLFAVYIDEFIVWDRRLLREVIAATFVRGAEEETLAAELVHLDEKLITQLTELLSGFQAAGRIRPAVEPAEAAMLLYSALMAQLFIYLSFPDFDRATIHDQTARQVDIAFQGLAAPYEKAN